MSGPRKMTPRGQMTRPTNSGPAVMMMPPHIRATFVPNPPLKSIPPIRNRRKHPVTGVMDYLVQFEQTAAKERVVQPTPKVLKDNKAKQQEVDHEENLKPKIEEYRTEQKDSAGEFQGMNCYNTMFVGRVAYEVNERKLLREMESFGPVKDIKLVSDKEGKSRGYAFVEYENEEDMKRAYRAADGMKIEGREIVVDVERGHTVPTWLPRRLGGGLGGTRLGGRDKNVTTPGRFDPSRPESRPMPPGGMDGPPPGMGRGQGPPMGYGGGYDRGGYGGGGYNDGPPGPYRGGPPPPGQPGYGGGYGGPPRGRGGDWGGDRGGGGGGGGDRGGDGGGRYDGGRKRYPDERSRSPDRRHAQRPRY